MLYWGDSGFCHIPVNKELNYMLITLNLNRLAFIFCLA